MFLKVISVAVEKCQARQVNATEAQVRDPAGWGSRGLHGDPAGWGPRRLRIPQVGYPALAQCCLRVVTQNSSFLSRQHYFYTR